VFLPSLCAICPYCLAPAPLLIIAHQFCLLRSAACQEQNDGRYMHGVGRQYSEPCETLWANVAPQGVTTQVGVRFWLIRKLQVGGTMVWVSGFWQTAGVLACSVVLAG
jgi:hypothetical protein